MFKPFYKLVSTIILVVLSFCFPAFSQEDKGGIMFDDIPGYTRMHTADWINDNFDIVSNQLDVVNERLDGHDQAITNLNETVESNYTFMTNEFTNVWIAITNMFTNFDGVVSNIYEAISVESNRIDNIETNLLPAIDSHLTRHDQEIESLQTNVLFIITNDIAGITNKLNEHDSSITTLQENLDSVSNNVNTNYELITNLIYDVESNYTFMTNEFTNVWSSIDNINNIEIPRIDQTITDIQTNVDFIVTNTIENLKSDVTTVSTNLDYLITNTIPEIVDNMGINVIGAINADADYMTNSNISTMMFDKDSGFTVVTNEMGEKAVQISLGSAWTTLIPNIEQINPETGEPYPNLKPSGEETLAIKVVVTNETGTFWDYSNTNKNEKTFYIGIGNEIAGNVPYENVYTTTNIVVKDLQYPIGRYTNGAVIATDTSLKTIFANMFSRYVPAQYTQPTFSLGVSGISKNTTYEYGTRFGNATLTGTFTPHDAGAVEGFAYFKNGSLVTTNETTSLIDSWTVEAFNLITRTTFTSAVYYAEGPVKPDGDGNPDPSGQIHAGSLSSGFYVNPSRYLFNGLSSNPTKQTLTDRQQLYDLSGTRRFVVNGDFTLWLTKGTHQTFVAVPQTYEVYSMLFNNNYIKEYEIIDQVETNTVENVICINLYSGDEDGGKTYKVYSYYTAEATPTDGTDYLIIKIRKK